MPWARIKLSEAAAVCCKVSCCLCCLLCCAAAAGLHVEPWAWARMKLSEADLLEERALALQVLAAAAAAAV